MDGKLFIKTLQIKNLLSFGSTGIELELQPLNVLIGPNGSGKSNLLEAIGLLQAIPNDLSSYVRERGGINEWLWKGSPTPIAEIKTKFFLFNYLLRFTNIENQPQVIEETVGRVTDPVKFIDGTVISDIPEAEFYHYISDLKTAKVFINANGNGTLGDTTNRVESNIAPEDNNQSILTQLKNLRLFPEIYRVGKDFSDIRLYRNWNFTYNTAPRIPQRLELAKAFLDENAGNLTSVLFILKHRYSLDRVIERITEELKRFNEAVEEIIVEEMHDEFTAYGGPDRVQLFIRETSLDQPISASRLSDGTLRYLALLSILCHPQPPPIVCIEEPELGLHPDILPNLAKLLIEASQRTQLVITTHSEMLVSALSEIPEAVVVCERDNDGTHLRRLEPHKLKKWLEDYSLGQLWAMGELGGTRW